jgi:hypothetical protein
MAAAGSETPIAGAPTTERIDAKGHVEPIFKLLVTGIGLAYGTGFLVVLTFLNGYGIREAGGFEHLPAGFIALEA